MMKLELDKMGFDRAMVDLLLQYEPIIEDTNHAVELLIKGPNGWLHNYAKNPFTGHCRICKEKREDHVIERNRNMEMMD